MTAVYIEAIEKRDPDGSVAAEDTRGVRRRARRRAGRWGGPERIRARRRKWSGSRSRPPRSSSPRPSAASCASRVTYIKASIFVEKDNHRKIIIGRQGKTIRQIGDRGPARDPGHPGKPDLPRPAGPGPAALARLGRRPGSHRGPERDVGRGRRSAPSPLRSIGSDQRRALISRLTISAVALTSTM